MEGFFYEKAIVMNFCGGDATFSTKPKQNFRETSAASITQQLQSDEINNQNLKTPSSYCTFFVAKCFVDMSQNSYPKSPSVYQRWMRFLF